MKDLVAEAVRLAAIAHKEQVDKGGEPSILHPLEVLARTRAYGEAHPDRFGKAPEYALAVAALHDVIEDYSDWADLLMDLPDQVFSSVLELSRKDEETYEEYILRVCESKDPWVLIVKMQDLSHNSGRGKIPDSLYLRYMEALERVEKALDRK